MSDDDALPVVERPTRMLVWEQQIGYLVAAVAAAAAILEWTSQHNALIGGAALADAAVLALAIHNRNRIVAALVGLPTLLLGKPPYVFVVVAYLLFLMLRTSNAQSRARRGLARTTVAQRRAAGEAHAEAKKAKRAQRKGQAPSASTKTPAPNRRYTPPKPKPLRRPPPPPAEGKAAR